ncbi:hypothetical protein EJB05_44619, partial [Eragrostis curvula]
MASHDNGVVSSDDETCTYALNLLGGFAVPFTIKAAIELGLIDQLLTAESAMTAEKLAERLPCPAKSIAMVDRMLRFLASYNVVRCATKVGPDGKTCGSYAAAPVCKWFARNREEDSVLPLGLMVLEKTFLESWYHIKDAVLEGETPFDKANGMSLFEYLGANGSMSTLFNQAMASNSVVITKKFVALFHGFQDIGVLVDVGGGNGTTLQMIINRYKNIRGINYDLPYVIAQAASIEGVEHVGGSMFDNIPRGNAVLLKWILHNWGDKECIKILKNCHTALPVNGKLIVLEYILPAEPEPTPVAQGAFGMDLHMLVTCPSGKERTEREFRDLAMEAGLAGQCKATYIFANVWALEFIK